MRYNYNDMLKQKLKAPVFKNGNNFKINKSNISIFIELIKSEINNNKILLYLTEPNYSNIKMERKNITIHELQKHIEKI